jgi:hypothetical protein
MRVAAAGLSVVGAILLFIGLRAALRASRYEMSERWFRYGLWATGIGIALQTVGVLIAVALK